MIAPKHRQMLMHEERSEIALTAGLRPEDLTEIARLVGAERLRQALASQSAQPEPSDDDLRKQAD